MSRKAPPARRSLGHALIVEDDPILAMALEQALMDGGAVSVAICASTATAMAALEERRPDVLVLDVNLADRKDGWALAELVIELSPTPPKIIFSTGSPERIPPEVAELGLVLAKPYDPPELVEAIHRQTDAPGLLARLRDAISNS